MLTNKSIDLMNEDIEQTIKIFRENHQLTKLADGVYEGLVWRNRIKGLNEDLSGIILGDSDYYIPSYGVCDSYKQIFDRYPQIKSSTRTFTVFLRKIVANDEPPQGGWRWHKNGTYIGVHRPQYEHIYDDRNEIPEVYMFSIVEYIPENIPHGTPDT